MFELSVACKYLRPRWRQLSVSIISLISILVIALVVWLIVVFFSVTSGLEKNWIQKLIALTAPIRITPTEKYNNSYYYRVDSISSNSDYSNKTIGEKLASSNSDPYNPEMDEEIPANWPLPDLDANGNLRDPVKIAFQIIENLNEVPDLAARDFEITTTNLRLQLLRGMNASDSSFGQSFLNQTTYLGSLDPQNSTLTHTILPLSMHDLNHSLKILALEPNNIKEDSPEYFEYLPNNLTQEKFRTFFDRVKVVELKTPKTGWVLPKRLVPESASWDVYVVEKEGAISNVVIPQMTNSPLGISNFYPATLKVINKELILFKDGKEIPVPFHIPLILPENISFTANLIEESIKLAKQAMDIHFSIHLNLQGVNIQGKIPLRNLEIAKADIQQDFPSKPANSPFWVYYTHESDRKQLALPSDKEFGEGILLPKSFREGVLVGDRGYLSYYSPTLSSIQEQRIPIFVAGFYDPGIIPIGGKYLIADQHLTSLIRSSQNQDSALVTNGINVRFSDLDQADNLKAILQKAFEKEGINSYWKIETYKEFEFTKDLIQQLQSDKNLFTLISTVIIIVACSNIISMLIILVNDKKLEIGILRAMGTTSGSIALIFGFSGVVMGIAGSLIGILTAFLTLQNLPLLINLLSMIQGHEAFNPIYFGDTLPNEISLETLYFVTIATGVISLLAGIVPAFKASLLRPSAILKAE